MPTERRFLRASLLSAALISLLPISACRFGEPAAEPASPFPAERRPALEEQGRVLKSAMDPLFTAIPPGAATGPDVHIDTASDCYDEDPDDDSGPAIRNWTYGVRVDFHDAATGRTQDRALADRLRRSGWTLGWDSTTLIAVKSGMYLEILLAGRTGPTRTLAITGHSRCVRSDGNLTNPHPPALTPYKGL